LRTIDEHTRASFPSGLNKVLDWGHSAQRVRELRNRDEGRFMLAQLRLEVFSIELTIIGDVSKHNAQALALGEHLPRNDIAMVFEEREQNHIALLEEMLRAARNEVNPFSRPTHKDNRALAPSSNIAGYRSPRVVVEV
jgi:hypothetical protein